MLMIDLASECRAIISRAEKDGLIIDDGNVIDLLADNLPQVPLKTLRVALVIAGLGPRFPKASSR